jgi:hypothetical protein
VCAGECLASIAFKHGHLLDTIWNDPANAVLKCARKDPNVLLDGDRLTIPPIRQKEESSATEQHHKFKRKEVPAKLNIRFVFDGTPRQGVPYSLDVNGMASNGKTDGDGWVRASIPADARSGVLTLFPDGQDPEKYQLALGCLAGR